jgi:hypothetical protein
MNTKRSLSGFLFASILPIALFVSVADKLGISIPTPPCIFNYFLGVECWGCGLTRAFKELLKLNFLTAISFHKLSPIIFLLVSYIFLKELKMRKKDA